jgi:hypothetical protein
VRTLTLSVIIGLIAHNANCADLNLHAIVSQSISNYEKDWEAALDFTYTEYDVMKDGSGRPKTTEVSQVFVVDGTPYERLIGKNGHPLTAEEALKENEKYQKASTARDTETPGQHDRRLRKYEEERQFLCEVPDAFDLRLVGHETIGGRRNFVIQLTPKAGYVPKSRNARMFSDIDGKLWVDEEDLRWTRAEANVINTISIGWVLARIGPGTRIALKQVKVDDEHWMLKELDINGSAKIMLVKNRTLDETVSYSDYKRVRAPAGTAAAKNR